METAVFLLLIVVLIIIISIPLFKSKARNIEAMSDTATSRNENLPKITKKLYETSRNENLPKIAKKLYETSRNENLPEISKILYDRNQDIIWKHLDEISGMNRSGYIDDKVYCCIDEITLKEGRADLAPPKS